MRIKCNQCQQELGEHQAMAGIFILPPAMGITAAACGPLHQVMGLRVLLLAIPLVVVVTWFFHELPRWITMLRHWRRRCPQCGRRDWGRPDYSGGFGL